MAPPKKFRIPTVSEMDRADANTSLIVEPTFKRRKDIIPDNPGSDTKTSHLSTRKTETSSQKVVVKENNRTDKMMDRNQEMKKDDLSNPTTSPSNTEDEGGKGNSVPNRVGSSNCLIVNSRQRGNPILKSVRNIPWEYGNIVPDYVMGQSHCALFLSLRYHQLHPNYIHDRLKQLGHSYDLRVLLVQVDVKEPHLILKELAKICILADCTLILAFSPEEAGRYLETYKIFENKPAEAIMEKTDDDFMAKFIDCVTRVKSVNKTDCCTLLTAFGSLGNVIEATEEDLSLCPGFGPQKAKRLHSLFREPFLRNPPTDKKKTLGSSLQAEASSSSSS